MCGGSDLQIFLNLTDIFFPYGTEPAALLDDVSDCHSVVWILLIRMKWNYPVIAAV